MHNLTKNLKAEFYRSRSLIFVVFVFCMAAVASFFVTGNSRTSQAASLSGFKPGNIISDAVMSNTSTMTLAEIQDFLDGKNKCDNRDYDEYLRLTDKYPNITWHWEGEPDDGHFVCMAQEKFGDTSSEIGEGLTAAEIIYAAAQENQINPQVLLVLLQKESSLITDKIPNSLDYSKATGYGCPDTAACDAKYSGFKNQIYRAAELFRYTLDNGSISYPEGRHVYIGYNPSSSCGGSQVYIENRATAALYRYTPYQPNASALNAGYGTGDICSAYGNRNFYLYFTDWFGSTQAAVDGELTVIPDGIYSLSAKTDSTKTLGVVANNVELQDRTEESVPEWEFQRDESTGYYTITETKSGKALSAATSSVNNGTNVELSRVSSCASQWKIYETPDHYLILESTCTQGMVLDRNGGSTQAGTNVQTWLVHNGDAQKWQIYSGETLASGVYTVSSSADPDKMIDLSGGWNYNGNNIQTWSQNHADAQKWRFDYDADHDRYTITNPATSKRFDLAGANTKPGTNINLWQPVDACSQYWKVLKSADNHYMIMSTCSPSRVVSFQNLNTGKSNNIYSGKVGDDGEILWDFHDQQIVADGNYVVESSINRDYALDIQGGYNYNGINVQLYQKNDADAQLWSVRYNEKTGDYTLLNQTGDRSLDLSGGRTKNGVNIGIWSNNTACAQRWTLVENSDQTYTFISTCSNAYALDLVGGFIYNANNVNLWQTNDENPQKWYLVPQD